jgi:molecular chaperone DnaK
LDGIPPAPRGVPQVEVTFDLDANGILNVKAADKATGKEQKITITASSGLSKDEVEKMRRDAELHADDDKKRRELIEMKNNSESLIYTTEKTIKEGGDKVTVEMKKPIEEKLANLKAVKDGDDIEVIKKAFDDLGTEIQKVGTELYKAAEANKGPENNGEQTKAEDSTTEPKSDEADFQDKPKD